jgi:hypothetical protein
LTELTDVDTKVVRDLPFKWYRHIQPCGDW